MLVKFRRPLTGTSPRGAMKPSACGPGRRSERRNAADRPTGVPQRPVPRPLLPFGEGWRNLPPIEGRQLTFMITRGEFDVHLAVWKVRAEAAGKREGTDFWIQLGGTGTAGESRTIRFAPRRRLMGTGPLTGDSAVFSFTGTFGLKSSPKFVAGVLEEVILSCDEHRTQGRESPAAVLPPPVPRQNGRPLAAPGEVGTEVGLDGGRTVRFGQAVGDVDQALGLVGREGQPPLARKGRDRETVAPTATLDFDTGRLEKIRFNATHVYARPVRGFAEAWQNPDSIGDLGLRLGLTRPEFQAYLDAWRKRAGDAGKREGADYRISGSGPDELTGEMIFVALAPG